MKELPIRKFTTVVGYLTEEVTITMDGQPIGTYRPLSGGNGVTGMIDLGSDVSPKTVNEIRKAIEPDKVKRQPDGTLTKGLGEIPGTKSSVEYRPVPKPK
jgi:hypothetical protein